LGSSGGQDVFILKLTSSGNFVWARKVGGNTGDNSYSLIIDDSGYVSITGTFTGIVDFDPGPGVSNLSSAGSSDIFVLKLDSSGGYVWAKRIGASSADYGYALTCDTSGNLYVTGNFSGTVDFDPGPLIYNMSPGGLFVLKLSPSGSFLWAKSTTNGIPSDIDLDDSGNVFTVGRFSSTVDFDPGTGVYNLTSSGSDVFIYKLTSNGDFGWAR